MRKSGCEKLKENPSTRVHLFFFLFLFCSRGKYVIKEISLVHFYFRRGPGLSPRWGKQTLSSQLFWRRNAARVERHQIGASFVQPRPNGNPETRNRSKNTNFSVLRKPIIPNTKAEPGTSEVEPGICMVVSKKNRRHQLIGPFLGSFHSQSLRSFIECLAASQNDIFICIAQRFLVLQFSDCFW